MSHEEKPQPNCSSLMWRLISWFSSVNRSAVPPGVPTLGSGKRGECPQGREIWAGDDGLTVGPILYSKMPHGWQILPIKRWTSLGWDRFYRVMAFRVFHNVTFLFLRTGLLAIVYHTSEENADFFSEVLEAIFIKFHSAPVICIGFSWEMYGNVWKNPGNLRFPIN